MGLDRKSPKPTPAGEVLTIALVALAAVLLAYVEYYFITIDGLPYREARQPVLGIYYPYHSIMLLLLTAVAFQPSIYQVLGWRGVGRNLRTTFALGLGSLLLGVLLEDSLWFVFRVGAPLPSDPFARQWIRPSDYTAVMAGYAPLGGLIVPVWYLVLVPPIIALFTAVMLTPSRHLGESP